MDKKCVLLLSGGMDSTTLLGYILGKGYEVYPVGIDYNQLHKVELDSANDIVKYYQKLHSMVHDLKILKLDLTQIGGSALTDREWEMPSMKDQVKTVVPFRNLLMSTLASAYGSTLNIFTMFMGPNLEDYPAYRDCRQPFYSSLQETLSLGYTYKKRFKIYTPFIKKTKKEIVRLGMRLGMEKVYSLTHSCYRGSDPACGTCCSCTERWFGFKDAGFTDPIEYEVTPERPLQVSKTY